MKFGRESPSFTPVARNPGAGKYVTYSQGLAYKFISLLGNSHLSIPTILKENPELPLYETLLRWRDKKPYFAKAWDKAKLGRAHRIFEFMLELGEGATPKNAHQVRVRFDILKFHIARICPELYGDKPSGTNLSVQTNVVIGPDQLNAIRGNLDRARAQFTQTDRNKKRLQERHSLKASYPPDLIEFDRRRAQTKSLKLSTGDARTEDAFPLKAESPSCYGNETQSETS